MAEKKTSTKSAPVTVAKRAAKPAAAAKPEKAAPSVTKTPAGRPVSAKAARAAAAKPPAAAKRVVRKRAVAVVAPVTSAPTALHAWRKGSRRTKVGMVVSAKQAHTVIVQVERLREHPLYKKVIRVRKKFAAHDVAGDVLAGDLVRIEEGRPYSATKRWRVVEVLSRAGEAGAAAPRVADIEAALEATDGSKEALAHAPLAPVVVAASEGAHE